MNYVEVIGGKPRQREYVESMVNYCIDMLMPRMSTLDITVTLKDIKDDAYGYCLSDSTRFFELEIDKNLSLRRLLTTVAHEMVHVKQYARKELQEDYDWLGKTYSPDKVSYWDQPWEIEAHGREVGLFIRWAEHHKLGDKAWTQDK